MSAILLAPLALLIDRPWLLPPVSGAAIWAMVALAILSTALGYVIYFHVLSRAGATNAVLVTFMVPASAILLGLLLLDETIEPRQLAGMIEIAFGLVAIDGRPARWLKRSLIRTAS
jgi:drug/metabolite transporter (DMT)-like permease